MNELYKTNNETIQQYLAFLLEEEEFAIDILKIKEIRSYRSLNIERQSDAPTFFAGYTHLYDEIIPIIDLRVFYGMKQVEHNEFNVVILLEIESTSTPMEKTSIMNFDSKSPLPPPAFAGAGSLGHLLPMPGEKEKSQKFVKSDILGVIVASVTDILALKPSQIKPASFYQSLMCQSDILGIGILEERMVSLLDVDKLVAHIKAELPKINPLSSGCYKISPEPILPHKKKTWSIIVYCLVSKHSSSQVSRHMPKKCHKMKRRPNNLSTS
jgi:purine-binding chemotaxis protein CheW